ncbi:hypothetical protein VDG40_09030 [Xanthomonas campestris pv. raphani]|uniref:hypothetical protein n=1 Tax=Xanthomonas campestris TaxID=339 RepID=UPI002B234BE9|nr:hypothetical protein [Xanthomonas campestris]MEA9937241.1 hypothetical protein [Xanthomonas campestris pv. raphani]
MIQFSTDFKDTYLSAIECHCCGYPRWFRLPTTATGAMSSHSRAPLRWLAILGFAALTVPIAIAQNFAVVGP